MTYKTSTWSGRIYQSTFLVLFNRIFNILTLFIFYPFAVAREERWRCKKTKLDGKQLIFVGRGRDLMGTWLIWWFLIIITLSIFGFIIPNKMQRWKVKNTHFVE